MRIRWTGGGSPGSIDAEVLDLMRALQAEMGMAILMITHDLGVVADMADEVVVMYAGRVVERCEVVELFEQSRHPYTRGLLESIPRKGLTKDKPLATIDGIVPSLLNPPVGCRFADRCASADELCVREDPMLDGAGTSGHLVACHHPLEVKA